MDDFSRDTSPDPLSMAMSPPTPHAPGVSAQRRSRSRSPIKPLTARSSNVLTSPSKSIIVDTPKSGNHSPWRIKVTVEAEPRDGRGSPGKKSTRTTTVPLRGSSSPAKKPVRRTPGPGDKEVKVPARKRKGTPIRRTPKAQLSSNFTNFAYPTTDEDDAMPDVPQSQLSPTRNRPSMHSLAQSRYPRLSHAREELDRALQDAVGKPKLGAQDHQILLTSDPLQSEAPAGDMTVSMNEDFTMVSVESLESYRKQALVNPQVQSTVLYSTIPEERPTNTSYLPSSPPSHDMSSRQPTYPDLSLETETARAADASDQSSAHVYDPMSWRPTGPLKNYGTGNTDESALAKSTNLDREPTEWRLEREAVSRRIEDANSSQVIVIDDTTVAGAEDNDADIWQEEASRSLHDESEQIQPPQASHSPKLDDLFSDQPLKPLRSKIPRTWRRESGADFSYVDSPEHGALTRDVLPEQAGVRKTSASTTDGERAVMTPPPTDDEVAKINSTREGDSSELTEPDAAATQLETQPAPSRKPEFSPLFQNKRLSQVRDHVPSPLSSSDSSPGDVTSSGSEDAGYFWQRNLPQVYDGKPRRPRPQRKQTMDLSELLNLKSSPSKPALVQPTHFAVEQETATSNFTNHPARPKLTALSQTGDQRLIGTPLKKSLLKSSKVRSPVVQRPNEEVPTSEDVEESFDSKTSDQRQLLGEANITPQHAVSSPATFYDTEEHSSLIEEADVPSDNYLEESTEIEQEPMGSYQEHLNLDSPTKIRVKFNDSTVQSSLLVPTREYSPLFDDPQQTASQHSPGTRTLVCRREPQAGVLSRLSSTFWAAVIRPTGPTEIIPSPPQPEPEYSPRLRARLRRRYGVVPSTHPWTMVHMRTLHRMENSRTSGRYDSIIPKTGELPSSLRRLVGTRQKSIADYEYTFFEERAHVVAAMMQTLVDPDLVRAMETGEIDFLGDSAAKSYRETDKQGRRGIDSPFAGYNSDEPAPGSKIDVLFIVRALGNAVYANDQSEKRRKLDAEPSDSE